MTSVIIARGESCPGFCPVPDLSRLRHLNPPSLGNRLVCRYHSESESFIFKTESFFDRATGPCALRLFKTKMEHLAYHIAETVLAYTVEMNPIDLPTEQFKLTSLFREALQFVEYVKPWKLCRAEALREIEASVKEGQEKMASVLRLVPPGASQEDVLEISKTYDAVYKRDADARKGLRSSSDTSSTGDDPLSSDITDPGEIDPL